MNYVLQDYTGEWFAYKCMTNRVPTSVPFCKLLMADNNSREYASVRPTARSGMAPEGKGGQPMNAKKNLGASLLVCAVLASPATFAASVTYDFTGTVTGVSGGYASIADGTTITGTYTINVANGVPSQSSLPVTLTSVSLTSEWYYQEYSGTNYSIPSNSAYVFSSTANVGAFSYQTSAIPGAYISLSHTK